MVEAKRRLRAIDRILGAKKPLTQSAEIDTECAFLQLRKIVELITFSAIVSDEQRYQRSRELDAVANPKDKGDYTLDWNAAEILVRLSKISPHFLPRPLGPMKEQPDGVKHFEEASAKLIHSRLIEIYKLAGGFAHMPNPYKPNGVELEKKKKETARAVLEKEVAYIKAAIWEHVKIGLAWNPASDPKLLDESASAWLIWFGDKSTDEVRMSQAIAA
ncbi:MAG TPA: hypothetical protein VI279_13100, partial [Rhodocyclaceae bacterium]